MFRFSQFPYEVRCLIYQCTLEPRYITFKWTWGDADSDDDGPMTNADPDLPVLHVTSPAAVPPALHLCQESRELLTNNPAAKYSRAFQVGTMPRYIWIDFEIDIVDIGGSGLMNYEAEKDRIRLLKLSREYGLSWHEESYGLEFFSRLEKLFIVCLDRRLCWADEVLRQEPGVYWPISRKKVWVSNKDGSDMVPLEQNDAEGIERDRKLQNGSPVTEWSDLSSEGFTREELEEFGVVVDEEQ